MLVRTQVDPDGLDLTRLCEDDAQISFLVKLATEQDFCDMTSFNAYFNDLVLVEVDGGGKSDAAVAVRSRCNTGVFPVLRANGAGWFCKPRREADVFVVKFHPR